MIALLLAATIGQLPILPPLPFNENSKADVATVGYLAELESFHRRVDGFQREINREPDEKRREVLRTQLDEYQRDVVPLLDVIRRAIGRMRAKERGQTDLAVLTVEGVVVDQRDRRSGGCSIGSCPAVRGVIASAVTCWPSTTSTDTPALRRSLFRAQFF